MTSTKVFKIGRLLQLTIERRITLLRVTTTTTTDATSLQCRPCRCFHWGPQPHRPPTPHVCLSIPELLDLIFSFLDHQSNATNALVCKHWSDIALSALWRDVHDLWRLVSLIVPLRKRRDSVYVRRIMASSNNTIEFMYFLFYCYCGPRANSFTRIIRLASFFPLRTARPQAAIQRPLRNAQGSCTTACLTRSHVRVYS